MNANRRFFIFCAMLALSFGLLSVGAGRLMAGTIDQSKVTISVQIVENPSNTWSYTPPATSYAADGSGGYDLVGQPEFDILQNRAHIKIEDVQFNNDPFVLNNILVTNTTTSTQIFSAFVGL